MLNDDGTSRAREGETRRRQKIAPAPSQAHIRRPAWPNRGSPLGHTLSSSLGPRHLDFWPCLNESASPLSLALITGPATPLRQDAAARRSPLPNSSCATTLPFASRHSARSSCYSFGHFDVSSFVVAVAVGGPASGGAISAPNATRTKARRSVDGRRI